MTNARKSKAARRAASNPPKAAKTPTPLEERSFVTDIPSRRAEDAIPAGFAKQGLLAPRPPKRVAKFLESGGIK